MPHNVNLLAIFSFCRTPGMIGGGGGAMLRPVAGAFLILLYLFCMPRPYALAGAE